MIRKYFPQFFDFADSLYTDDLSKEIGKKILEFTNEFNSLLNFLFIPFIALISRIVFYIERYNFTEHLVIFFYTMSLFSMFSILTNLLVLLFIPDYFLIWTSVIYFFFFIYHCYIFTGIFSLSFKRLLFRILLFLPLFFIVFIFVSILLFYMVLFSGHIDINNSIPQS